MGRTYTSPNGLQPSRNTEEAQTDAVKLAPGSYQQGQAIGQFTGVTAVNEVQTITVSGTPDGGSFRLAFNGQVTAAIAYNAAAAAVQTALEALPNIGAGNVTCTGGAFPGTPVVATFGGALAGQNQPLMTLFSNSLTGGSSPTAAVAETTSGRAAGAYYGAYDDALSNGLQVCRAFLKYAVEVNEQGFHTSAGIAPQGGPSQQLTATAYFAGTFFTSQLPGLDANGAADVGRMIVGVSSALTNAGAELRMT